MQLTAPTQPLPIQHRSDAPSRFDRESLRFRIYICVGIGLFLLGYAMLAVKAYARGARVDFLVNDAPGFYAYLPSLLIDHDLDFSNQMEIQFEGQGNRGVGPSFLRNRHQVGVAITLAPMFIVAHGLTLICHGITGSAVFAPNGYSLLYQPLCFAWIMALCIYTMVLCDRLLTRHFRVSGPAILAGILCFWLGSNYLWYCFREPFMAHALGAFWVVATVYLFDRITLDLQDGRIQTGRILLIAFCVSMALACRLTSAFLLPFFVYLLVRIVRSGLLKEFLAILPAALLCIAPLLVQLAIMRLGSADKPSAGGVQAVGYDAEEGFNLFHPHLWNVLFSDRHGLFFWSPVLLLAVGGIIWQMIARRAGGAGGGWRDPLLVCFILSFGLLWYLNASWKAWWFGSSFGLRAFVEIAGLGIIGLAFAFQAARQSKPAVRNIIIAAAVLGIGVNYLFILLRITNRIQQDLPPFWSQQQIRAIEQERIAPLSLPHLRPSRQ
jgi:hypothetical protein